MSVNMHRVESLTQLLWQLVNLSYGELSTHAVLFSHEGVCQHITEKQVCRICITYRLILFEWLTPKLSKGAQLPKTVKQDSYEKETFFGGKK